MPNLAAGIIGGSTLLGVGSSIYAGNKQAGAVTDAANTAAKAELQMYNQSRADLAPYREVGYGALDALAQLYGVAPKQPIPTQAAGGSNIGDLNSGALVDFLRGRGSAQRVGYADSAVPGGLFNTAQSTFPKTSAAATTAGAPRDLSGFYASPDYDFRMTQAMKALQNSYAARGGALSGPAAAAVLQRSGDLASGEFNNYANRLAALAGIGQTATTNTAQLGAGTAGNLSNIYINQGNARASTYGQTAAGVNNALQGGLGNWMLLDYLKGGATGGSAIGSGGAGGGFLSRSV